jgi:hypothetical protein
LALAAWGLSGAYWAWLMFLLAGTLAYALLGHDAWYFEQWIALDANAHDWNADLRLGLTRWWGGEDSNSRSAFPFLTH